LSWEGFCQAGINFNEALSVTIKWISSTVNSSRFPLPVKYATSTCKKVSRTLHEQYYSYLCKSDCNRTDFDLHQRTALGALSCAGINFQIIPAENKSCNFTPFCDAPGSVPVPGDTSPTICSRIKDGLYLPQGTLCQNRMRGNIHFLSSYVRVRRKLSPSSPNAPFKESLQTLLNADPLRMWRKKDFRLPFAPSSLQQAASAPDIRSSKGTAQGFNTLIFQNLSSCSAGSTGWLGLPWARGSRAQWENCSLSAAAAFMA